MYWSLDEPQPRLRDHVEEHAEQALLEGVLDVDDVVQQARAGELGDEERAEVELGDDLGAAGAQKAALPDLAEALADDEVLARADAFVGRRDAGHGVDLASR